MGMEANYSYKVQVYKNAKNKSIFKETTLIKTTLIKTIISGIAQIIWLTYVFCGGWH